MSLKYTQGKAGQIKYTGRQVTVWNYSDWNTLLEEFKHLNRCLDEDSMAWIGQEYLVYKFQVVGKTTRSGSITWLDTPMELPADMKFKRTEPVPKKVVGKRREAPIVEDAADVDVKALWASATRTDWEAIMVKTSW